jgi:hypothetical protein
MDKLKYHDILYNDAQLGPYPDHLLKRVDKPTNDIPGPVERRSERESVFSKSLMGDFGEELSQEFKRMTNRYPIGGRCRTCSGTSTSTPSAARPLRRSGLPYPTILAC